MLRVLSSRTIMASPRGTRGELIRALRIKQQLLQEDVAERAGISVTHLSRIENGRSEPTRETIERLAPVLGVTAAYLDVDLLADAILRRATDPDARSFVERVLALHDRIAVMSSRERERLYRVLEAATRGKR